MDVDGLVGCDPDDEVEVRFGGATFVIGPIPAGIWEQLSARRAIALQDAHRRAIRTLTERGENPGEVLEESGEFKQTKADVEAYRDPEFIRLMTAITTEATSYGLKRHEKFFTRKGAPVPLAVESVTVEGCTVNRLAEVTMRYYRVNVTVMRLIFTALYKLNELEAPAKKV